MFNFNITKTERLKHMGFAVFHTLLEFDLICFFLFVFAIQNQSHNFLMPFEDNRKPKQPTKKKHVNFVVNISNR